MHSVNMLKPSLRCHRLVKAVEQGQEHEIVIARNGRPVAKLVPMDTVPAGQNDSIVLPKINWFEVCELDGRLVFRQYFKGWQELLQLPGVRQFSDILK